MATVEAGIVDMGGSQPLPVPPPRPVLHRLAAVRREKGLSLQAMAARLRVDVETVRQQEQATSDLPLSILDRWRQALDVPLGELLIEASHPLALPPIPERKTAELLEAALAILKQTKQTGIRRMAHTLVDQLVELRPELKSLATQCGAGSGQLLDAQGQSVGHELPLDVFLDAID
jgi:transcriptional regulator with XRE-family HTH domain